MTKNERNCTECGKHPAKTGSDLCGWCARRKDGGSEKKHKPADLVGVTVAASERRQKITLQFDVNLDIGSVRIISQDKESK